MENTIKYFDLSTTMFLVKAQGDNRKIICTAENIGSVVKTLCLGNVKRGVESIKMFDFNKEQFVFTFKSKLKPHLDWHTETMEILEQVGFFKK